MTWSFCCCLSRESQPSHQGLSRSQPNIFLSTESCSWSRIPSTQTKCRPNSLTMFHQKNPPAAGIATKAICSTRDVTHRAQWRMEHSIAAAHSNNFEPTIETKTAIKTATAASGYTTNNSHNISTLISTPSMPEFVKPRSPTLALHDSQLFLDVVENLSNERPSVPAE